MTRVALKVDCDTDEGTREGVPRLPDIFAERGIRATFFFTLGPDRSGRRDPADLHPQGFPEEDAALTRPLALWLADDALRDAVARAHDRRALRRPDARRREGRPRTGVHGWDHVRWHDRLDAMSAEEIRADYGRAHAEYLRIFGVPARSSAAPGWTANERSLEAQEERSLLFSSDTRGGSYFFPEAGGRVFHTLEIPTTLPTLDETMSWPQLKTDADQRAHFRKEAARHAGPHDPRRDRRAAPGRRSFPGFSTTGSPTA